VYDVYSDANGFAAMEKDQTNKTNQFAGYNKPYLFLLSWTLTGHTGGILDLELLSRMANPQLARKLKKLHPNKLPNIVYLDYLNGYLCSAIIALNYQSVATAPAQPAPAGGIPVLA
jgi:hypothetical protein